MKATHLQTNYLTNPIGVDYKSLHLSWIPNSLLVQTAYRVRILCMDKEIFDTGKIISEKTFCDVDVALPTRNKITWNVVLWDENDRESEILLIKQPL